MAPLLATDEIEAALRSLPGWTYADGALARTAELASFRRVLDAVAAIGAVAEERNHHPDIDIRWRTITLVCSSHSDGGVTAKDVELAGEISRLLEPAADGSP